MCRHQVAGEIVEQSRLRRRGSHARQNVPIRLRIGFGTERDGAQVPQILKQMRDRATFKHAGGMVAATIGEHEPAPGQHGECARETMIRVEDRKIDIVHIVEIFFRVGPVQAHEAAQRRPVIVIVGFLNSARLVCVETEMLLHKQSHACFYLGEQVAFRRVKRVVEIENPDIHVPEIGMGANGIGVLHCAGNMVNGRRGRKPTRDCCLPSEAVLSVAGLRKVYRRTTAVDGVSFSIAPGEIVGLLGPNGAGKTTTVNMILGVLEPTSGAITIEGIDLLKQRSAALSCTNFAAVYAALPGNLTVEQKSADFRDAL